MTVTGLVSHLQGSNVCGDFRGRCGTRSHRRASSRRRRRQDEVGLVHPGEADGLPGVRGGTVRQEHRADGEALVLWQLGAPAQTGQGEADQHADEAEVSRHTVRFGCYVHDMAPAFDDHDGNRVRSKPVDRDLNRMRARLDVHRDRLADRTACNRAVDAHTVFLRRKLAVARAEEGRGILNDLDGAWQSILPDSERRPWQAECMTSFPGRAERDCEYDAVFR